MQARWRNLSGIDIAKRSVRGSLVLFVGSFSSTLISAVTIFLIARLLGLANYGIYSLALVVPSILQIFLGLGVTSAVIRYSAYSISVGNPQEARRFTLNAIYFTWLTGAALALLNYLLANPLSTLLLHRPYMTPYLQLMSLGIAGYTLLTTITFAAIGWNWMSLSGFSQVAQSIIKLGLSPFLIVVGLGVAGALTGQIVSLILAGGIGTAILYRGRLRGSLGLGGFTSDVKVMLRFGLPLYAGGVIWNMANNYLLLVLATIASDTVFGLYQAASNFLVPITLVSSSLVSALFPAFTSIDGIGGDAKSAFRDAYKFVAFLLTPITVFIVSAAVYLVRVFYGATFSGSVPYLQLLALAYIPIAFGYTVHPAFFSGFGRTKLAFLVYASSSLTLVTCATLFSLRLGYGVYGLIYATFLSLFVAWLVGTLMAARFMGATLDLKANAAILVVSAVAYAVTASLPPIASSSALSLLVDLLVFFGIYATLAPVAGAVNDRDLDVMEHTFRDLKLVGTVLGVLLRYERRILSLRGKLFN
jgi:O-antigen/teichoic acid export membrane protein